jgi:hypothetical protein
MSNKLNIKGLVSGSITSSTLSGYTGTTYNLLVPKPHMGYWSPVKGTTFPIFNEMPSKFHQWMMNKLFGWKFSTEVPATITQNTKQLLKG